MLPPIGLKWRKGLWRMTAYIIMGIIIAILAVVVLAQHFNLRDADKLVNSMEDEINSLKNKITDLKTDIVMLHREKTSEGLKGKIKNYVPFDSGEDVIPLDLDNQK